MSDETIKGQCRICHAEVDLLKYKTGRLAGVCKSHKNRYTKLNCQGSRRRPVRKEDG